MKIEVIRTATGLHVDVPDEYVGATEKIEVALPDGTIDVLTNYGDDTVDAVTSEPYEKDFCGRNREKRCLWRLGQVYSSIHGWMPTWTLHKSAIGTVYYEIGWKGDFEDIPLPERKTIQPEDK